MCQGLKPDEAEEADEAAGDAEEAEEEPGEVVDQRNITMELTLVTLQGISQKKNGSNYHRKSFNRFGMQELLRRPPTRKDKWLQLTPTMIKNRKKSNMRPK